MITVVLIEVNFNFFSLFLLYLGYKEKTTMTAHDTLKYRGELSQRHFGCYFSFPTQVAKGRNVFVFQRSPSRLVFSTKGGQRQFDAPTVVKRVIENNR